MRQLLTFIFILLILTSVGQSYKKCKIYQYIGWDSLDKELVSEEIYNTKGQLISYYYKGYKENFYESKAGTNNFNYYNNKLLTLSKSIQENGDSTKVEYYYNSYGKLIKEKHFDFNREVKKYSNKNNKIFYLQNEAKRKHDYWQQTSETSYQYDKKRNVIKCIQKEFIYNSADNVITYQYDSLNRVIKRYHLDCVSEYDYFSNGYKYVNTCFDEIGRPKEQDENSPVVFIYILNDFGKIVEQKNLNTKGDVIYREITEYNSFNHRIIKQTNFNEVGTPDITHIYVYE